MANSSTANASMRVDELVAQLGQVHGTALRTVVLYGSAASEQQVAGHSDQNVLVIVETLALASLRELADVTRRWQDAGNPPPLTLTVREWQRSSDIFPMEYADILAAHKILHGALPLEGIAVVAADLRLQTEHEAMGKLLRLRRGVMTAGSDRKRQAELLRASLSAFQVIFRAVLRLHGVTPPREANAVARAVATQCGFDAAPFERVAALVRGTSIPEHEIELVLAGYVQGVESLVAYLDQFTPPHAGDSLSH
jgi:hypothetical protein